MAEKTSVPLRVGDFAKADRHFARQVFGGLALVAAVAIVGPLIAYRSDVAEAHQQIHARVTREAQVHAEALALHLRVLQAELERVAQRPEIDFRDGTDKPEQEILDVTHRPHSALFEGGVLLVDAAGRVVVSEPKTLVDTKVAGWPWFQKVLTIHGPRVDAFREGSRVLVVAVPIVRDRAIIGVLAGLVDPAKQELAGAKASGEHHELVVADPEGVVFLPDVVPAWARGAPFLDAITQPPNDATTLAGKRYVLAVREVGSTGLKLVLAADEDALVAPVRGRFLLQLFFIAVLQFLTILLFSFYLRRSYRSFLVMESRAAEQEKLAALGSASSLIAHEVKNSLNGISAAASLLTEGGETGLPVKTIRGQSERLKHLATSLLYFARPASPPQRVATHLEQLVHDTVESLQALPEADDVRVMADVEQPTEVQCDPLLLSTALDNLIRNAMEAAVAAKDLGHSSAPSVRIRSGRAGGVAFISVEDNAGGPPADVEPRLFEPFVSGKPKGIGLGLSMARRAVEQQGGSLAFERTAAGSRFTIRLGAA